MPVKLYHASEVPHDGRGLLCRQSRFWAIVRLFAFLAFLLIPIICGWRFDAPLIMWAGVAFLAIIIPIMWFDMAATFRRTNWAVRIDSDGLWINLCSYRDRVPDALSVVRLDYSEIATLGKHTEAYTTPSERVSGSGSYGKVGGDTIWRSHFLELCLTHEHADALQAALNDLRLASPQKQRTYVPIWLVGPDVVRIPWLTGHGPVLAPGLAKAISHLKTYVQVTEPTRRERPNWPKLSPEEAQELARELACVYGDSIDATTVLVRAAGIPYNEANRMVTQFESEAVQS
jgi:hypothetical protein